MDEGDAGLLLQGVQILHDGLLGLAHVDDHLGAACEQGLQVQLALAAVKLAQDGQVIVLGLQILLRRGVPFAGDAHQPVGAQGEEDDLSEGPADSHLVDGGGQLYGPAHRVCEGPGGGLALGQGGGAQGKQHQDRQQQGNDTFHGSFLLTGCRPAVYPRPAGRSSPRVVWR